MSEKEKSTLMESLLLTGAMVKVHCSIWSARKKLNPEELGLDEVNEDLVSLGSKRLLPKEQIQRLEQIRGKAARVLSKNGFSFDFGSNFIPNSQLKIVNDELSKLRDEFLSILNEIGESYPETRHKMKNDWEIEAIAASKGDHDKAFMIMDKIEKAFPKTWDEIRQRFHFDWMEYRDINVLAKEFIESQANDIVERVREMAETIKTRLEGSGLSERYLGTVRVFIKSLQDGLLVFKSEKLDEMVGELEAWSMEGAASDAAVAPSISKAMADSMGKVIGMADTMIGQIKEDAVKSLTTYRTRRIE